MSYNTAIPEATDPILLSQGQILANYNAINSVFNNNHYPLTGTNQDFQGMHNFMVMRPQASDPVTDATHTAFYNKLDANSIPELFFKPNNNQTPIQLTYPSLNTSLSSTAPYSFVAGPFVIYAGIIKGVTNNQVITLSPTTNLLYVGLTSANITSTNLPTQIRACVPKNINSPMSTFTVLTPTIATLDCYYIAIGQ
jgi:hypothetical protein